MRSMCLSWALALTIFVSPAWSQEVLVRPAPQSLIGTEMELRHNLHYLTYLVLASHVILAATAPLMAAQGVSSIPGLEDLGAVKLGVVGAGYALEAAFGFFNLPLDYWSDRLITKHMITRLGQEIAKTCPDCRIEKVKARGYGKDDEGLKITYPDGWWLQLAGDPMVIEITHAPVSNDRLKELESRIQRDLFDNGSRIGLRPSRFANNLSGTHFNLGISAFNGDGVFARNFVVDFYNHPELALGLWHKDIANARPVTATRKGREQFQADIAEFDALSSGQQTIERLAALLTQSSTSGSPALSLHNAQNQIAHANRRFEIRASRGVESAEHLVIMAEIIQARLVFLAKQTGPIPVRMQAPARNPIEKLRRYRQFIEEMGYPWERAAKILPLSYRFLNQPIIQRCAQALSPTKP